MVEAVGLISGDRQLGLSVVSWANKTKTPLFVVGIKGCVEIDFQNFILESSYREFGLGQLSKTLRFFKKNRVRKVVLVGGVSHGRVSLNFMVLKLFIKLLFMKNRYDGILRLVKGEFLKNGMEVVGIDKLIPEMLIGCGVLGSISPMLNEKKEIKILFPQAIDFAKTDKGQSVIAFQNQILAVEDFRGTDNLINRAGELKNGKSGGFLIKVMKPNQDSSLDIPVIGVKTIENLYKNKFLGVVVEANRTIVENREAVIKLANELNIFIVGV